MTNGPDNPEPTVPERLTPPRTARLLTLGIAGPRRPIDDVLARLEQPGGRQWFADEIRGLCAAHFGRPADALITGELSAAAIGGAKEAVKGEMADAPTHEQSLRLIARYFALVAAALAAHGERIASRSDLELEEALLDLATASPAPFDAMFRLAAERCAATPSSPKPPDA